MHKTDKEILGARLREFRKNKNMSMYAVAKKGGIRASQVKDVEEGIRNYTIDVFHGYVKGCGLTIQIKEDGKIQG